MTNSNVRYAVAIGLGALTLGLVPRSTFGQGCEPIRFTVPVRLGGAGEAYQPGREWQLTVAYRQLHSSDWFTGTEQNDNLAPGGTSPVFEVHTVVVDLAYALNDRVRARVSVPYSRGSFERRWADGQFHEQTANGIGDVSVMGEAWLLEPRTHERGNISLGLGLKAPTGSHTQPSQFYLASGAVDFPADQTIQPGDGGWAILTQLQAFRRVTESVSLYASGSYMISPKDRTELKGSPVPGPTFYYWSVPDVYSMKAGGAFSVLPDQGLFLSLGVRVDGIPVNDLLGGGDENTIKRTSRITFIDPGLSYTRGKDNFTVSVPWRVKVNRMKSLTEQLPTASPTANSGGFAKYLVFASYSRRL